MASILKKIYKYKLEEIHARKNNISFKDLVSNLKNSNLIERGFLESLKKSAKEKVTPVIAEIKKASPSQGIIRENFDVAEIAKSYEEGGATCLSVLTDFPSFQGKDEYIVVAKNNCNLPILRKDFFIDPYQVVESKLLGADCILIILAMLDKEQARELYDTSIMYDMDAIFEVHNEEEYDIAEKLNARIIGINNRNLHNFETSIETTTKLSHKFNKDIFVLSESGIKDRSDIEKLNSFGVNGYLIGQSFMAEKNIKKAIKELIK
ncbi:indole-3-glycerol phosphate synthase TrpC [Hyphomicrobiales bacterium]|jgi:indole-3-glycerol phosphate synthase|nr:indole-3-glycerol phosphate synthase TrpC [Hyphomicrobiales bacterium]|tara:strand:- start:801 stop:1592 length:792 start_codon:yes stop_codon:yes gene_type:complete